MVVGAPSYMWFETDELVFFFVRFMKMDGGTKRKFILFIHTS